MNYSPLAIHCASLCFDVIQSSEFKNCTHDDIDGFRKDIYGMICDRSSLQPSKSIYERKFATHVTNGVLIILYQCLKNPNARDSVWILSALESRIEHSINTILH